MFQDVLVRTGKFSICAFLCVLLIASCDNSSNTEGDAYYFPIVVLESQQITNPVGSISSEDRDHKYGSAWARRIVSIKENRSEARSFYELQLQKHGWKRLTLLPSRSTVGFDEIEYYCKNKIEAELAFEMSMPEALAATSLKMTVYWSSGNDKVCLQ